MARILIVDDEPLIAMLVEEWLSDLGHEPIGPALSLADARHLMEQPLDAALVDLTLGGESGAPVAEALAAKGVPFVYATGQSEEDLARLPRAKSVLLKPYTFEAFEAAIATLLAAG